jgi:hypothetical protein
MCETRTETTLIYFLKLEPKFLYKTKEPPIANNIIGSAGYSLVKRHYVTLDLR